MSDLPPQLLSLIVECKEHPEDDAPRLVLADWLQEHGSTEVERARGEFIALQCRPASPRPEDSSQVALVARAEQLQMAHECAWLGPWAEAAEHLHWRKGFAVAQVRGAGWLRGELLRPAAWACLSDLTVVGLQPRSVPRLARSKGLAHLSALDLWGNHLGEEGARALAESPHLANLTSLGLGQGQIGEEGMRSLAGSPRLARLTSLNLWYNALGIEGLRALLDSPHFNSLTTLDLGYNGLGAEGARMLAASPKAAGLTWLRLQSNRLGTAGARHLAGSPCLANLTHLDLSYNRIDIGGARALVGSSYLTRLASLDMRGNTSRSDAREMLRDHFGEVVGL